MSLSSLYWTEASPELLRRHLIQKADQLRSRQPPTLLDWISPAGQQGKAVNQRSELNEPSSKRAKISSETSKGESSTSLPPVPALLLRLQDQSSLTPSETNNSRATTSSSKKLIERIGGEQNQPQLPPASNKESPAPPVTSLSNPLLLDCINLGKSATERLREVTEVQNLEPEEATMKVDETKTEKQGGTGFKLRHPVQGRESEDKENELQEYESDRHDIGMKADEIPDIYPGDGHEDQSVKKNDLDCVDKDEEPANASENKVNG
ncbi:hypothetical protein H0H92_001613 [Tricholoma furcatifolium]|nr:hypothetical protein H0H92_001613 [Tricholoma furcatifolium]